MSCGIFTWRPIYRYIQARNKKGQGPKAQSDVTAVGVPIWIALGIQNPTLARKPRRNVASLTAWRLQKNVIILNLTTGKSIAVTVGRLEA